MVEHPVLNRQHQGLPGFALARQTAGNERQNFRFFHSSVRSSLFLSLNRITGLLALRQGIRQPAEDGSGLRPGHTLVGGKGALGGTGDDA